MLAIFKGTYLVFGEAVEPRVIALSEHQYRIHLDRTVTRRGQIRKGALAATFGSGIDTAFCAWDEATMRLIGETYEGIHQALVRALAAAIVLDIPFQTMYEGRRGGKGGGERVRARSTPVKPQPGGAAVAVGAGQP